MKICTKCGNKKPIDAFHKEAKGANGRASRCKICVNKATAIWRENNKNHVIESKKAWCNKNKELIASRQKAWKENNKGKSNAIYARRRATKLQATPLWHERQKINELYESAASIRKSGHDVVVDHIIPLINPIVCGLHCIDNLQILSAYENGSKGNKFTN